VRIFSTTEASRQGRWSYPEYLALRDRATSFDALVACGRRGTVVSAESGDQELALLNVVSLDFFERLGIRAAHGRLIRPGDEPSLEAQPSVMLGHAFWRRRFGGDPSVIGRTIRLGAGRPLPVTILGVLPASFRELDAASDRDLWVPTVTWSRLGNDEDFRAGSFRWFEIVGVRREDVGIGAADAEIKALVSALERENPDARGARSARVISDVDYRWESGGTNAAALVALVLFVVAITGVNLAALMLSRALGRSLELATRVALGASRIRLLRETLAEGAVLGAAGTVAGLSVSLWLIRLLPVLVVQPPGFRSFLAFELDRRVLGFTVLVSLITTLLTMLAPAWGIVRGNLGAAIPAGRMAERRSRRGRLAGALVVAQVAVSLALLSSAALLARSFDETRRVDLGFSRRPLLTAWIAPTASTATMQAMAQRLSALPGMASVAVAIRAPLSLSGGGLSRRVEIPGAVGSSAETADVKFGAVSANYFATLGIPIVRGRAFTIDDERPGEPVVIVSEPFVSRFFPAGDGVGRIVRLGTNRVEHRVVGVARDVVINRIGETPEPYFYLPFWRGDYGELTFLFDTTEDAAVAAASVRALVRQIDPQLEPRQFVPMNQFVGFSASDYRATAILALALAAIGLLLTTLGVYGVIAYRTTARTKEIGIRIALGATRRNALGVVLVEGARLVAIGLAIGLPATLVIARLMQSLLFGVAPWDPAALAGAAALLAITVTTAMLVPAWRATRISPSIALRESR
jgi:predicted permease